MRAVSLFMEDIIMAEKGPLQTPFFTLEIPFFFQEGEMPCSAEFSYRNKGRK